MNEFIFFICRECKKLAKVRLEPGEAENWEESGLRICAECLGKITGLSDASEQNSKTQE